MESGQNSPIPQTITLKSADHSDYMLKRLDKFYMNKEFCDVTLIAANDNTQVKAHRGALAVASDFFLAMFSTDFKDSKSKEVQLKDIDGVVLRLIIDFVYTASIELSIELVPEIIIAAQMYQINSLVNTCSNFIVEQLTMENCKDFFALAEHYGLTKLKEKTLDMISKNFSSFIKNAEFLQLNQAELCRLIDSDDLNVQTEEEVFHGIVQWFMHDEVSRTESILPLLKKVRFSNLSLKFISNNRGLVCRSNECHEFIWKWMDWLLCPDRRSEMIGLNTKSRKSCHIQTIIAFSCDLNFLHTFDRHTNSWTEKKTPHSLILSACRGSAFTISENKLFITGGIRFTEAINNAMCFDLKTLEEINLPPMNKKRFNHSSVCANGALYVLGGCDQNNLNNYWLDYIEKYDFFQGEWQVFDSGPFRRKLQSAVVNDFIYIIGSESMYSYNTATGVMSVKPSKKLDSDKFVFHADKGYLYAVGYAENSAIERYDPTTELWSYIRQLPGNYASIKCISYNGHLCVLGFNDNQIITSADEYYPETNEWKTSEICRLNDPIRIISVVELD